MARGEADCADRGQAFHPRERASTGVVVALQGRDPPLRRVAGPEDPAGLKENGGLGWSSEPLRQGSCERFGLTSPRAVGTWAAG